MRIFFGGAVVALRRLLLRIAVIAIVIPAAVPASASESVPSLSGLATNALVHAYHAAGLDGALEPPFRLQPFVVSVRKRGTAFEVTFSGETSKEFHFVSVDGPSGKILGTSEVLHMPGDQGLVLLPGIIAGEIIAAYRQALRDTRQARDKNDALRAGLYGVVFDAFPGATSIDFGPPPGGRPPDVLAPTPTPFGGCMGGCAWEYYSVKVQGGKMEISRVAVK